MKALLELLGQVSNWGDMVTATVSYQEIRTFTGPDETVPTGRHVYVVGVTICGTDKRITGQGSMVREAMLNCAHNVVAYHKEVEEWHRVRRENASKAIRVFLGGEQDA